MSDSWGFAGVLSISLFCVGFCIGWYLISKKNIPTPKPDNDIEHRGQEQYPWNMVQELSQKRKDDNIRQLTQDLVQVLLTHGWTEEQAQKIVHGWTQKLGQEVTL